jgi:hypothetical protein
MGFPSVAFVFLTPALHTTAKHTCTFIIGSHITRETAFVPKAALNTRTQAEPLKKLQLYCL